jgi:hypothetical protein
VKWPFSGVRELRGNTCFLADKQGLILEQEAERRAYLNELDVSEPLVVIISQRKE